MTWTTATITSVSTQGGNCVATVMFSDDQNNNFTDQIFGNDLTLDYVNTWAANRIISLNNRDTAVAALTAAIAQPLATATLVTSILAAQQASPAPS